MTLRNFTTAFAVVLFASVCVTSIAAPKKHHHNQNSQQAALAKAHHLIRLAAQEKAAWRAHLAKIRELPKAQRIAMKRHDRRFKRELVQSAAEHAKALKMAAITAKHHHSKQASSKTSARARHLAALQAQHEQRLAALEAKHHHIKQAASHVSARSRHLAALQAQHEARLAAILAKRHQIKVAELLQAKHKLRAARVPSLHAQHLAALQIAHAHNVQAAQNAHNQRFAQMEAGHLARLRAKQSLMAQRALANNARHASLLAAHNAHVAAQRSHWVALHGDGSSGQSIKFWETVAAHTPVKVITVDLNDSNVKVSAIMARHGNGTSEPFRQMIQRADPNVAVTGTFFSLDNLEPVGDIVIDGSLVHFGGMGTALCITPGNHARMVTCTWGRHHDWSDYDFVCACGPRLLERGHIVLDPRAERFRDQHMLAPNSRIAVGITPGNKIVFVMTHEPIYLGRLAKVMRSLGASEAMNLDAGTSTGFYYNGATLAAPGRKLTNMIVVYGRKERYERALDQLVPATYRRMDRSAHRQVSQLPQ